MDITRREAIRVGGLGLAGMASLLAGGRAVAAAPRRGRGRVARLAHLTDIHVQPEKRAGEGMAACLNHVQSLSDKPDLIVTGGDLVMDTFEQRSDRARLLWDLFTRTLRSENSLPVEQCLGNHDIWGWNKGESGTTGTEAQWGKKWAMEALGLDRGWHGFDVGGPGGWRGVVLDSVQPDPRDPNGYIGGIGDEQFAWLAGELKAAGARPVVIVSHISILTATCLINGGKGDTMLERPIPSGLMLTDAKRLVNLFARHPNVKLCLSGHMHENDRVDYQGVTYICDGAVSGNWWKGRHKMTDEGYGIVDLFNDGTFTHEYVRYGWRAEAE